MAALVLIFFLLGSAAVSFGAGLIYLPAGIITGGVALVILALMLVIAAGGKNPAFYPSGNTASPYFRYP